MRTIITGVAGFIGSTLADSLLAQGESVVGIDCFTPYYDTSLKQLNLASATTARRFTLLRQPLTMPLMAELLAEADVVYHLAAQPGVRSSWGPEFATYVDHNINATQQLLEAYRTSGVRPRLVFASSSSIYGEQTGDHTTEDARPAPVSPYGVTKVTCEHLIHAYSEALRLDAAVLRLFTVYGPRQRPDMAFHRACAAALGLAPAFPVFGDGSAQRDFTYVDDVVSAMTRAATAELRGTTSFNIAGGGVHKLSEALDLIAGLVGRPVPIDPREGQIGDVRATSASTRRAQEVLGWEPQIPFTVGLARQLTSMRAPSDERDTNFAANHPLTAVD